MKKTVWLFETLSEPQRVRGGMEYKSRKITSELSG